MVEASRSKGTRKEGGGSNDKKTDSDGRGTRAEPWGRAQAPRPPPGAECAIGRVAQQLVRRTVGPRARATATVPLPRADRITVRAWHCVMIALRAEGGWVTVRAGWLI